MEPCSARRETRRTLAHTNTLPPAPDIVSPCRYEWGGSWGANPSRESKITQSQWMLSACMTWPPPLTHARRHLHVWWAVDVQQWASLLPALSLDVRETQCMPHKHTVGTPWVGRGGVIEVLVHAGGFLLLMRSNPHPPVGSPMVYASGVRGGYSPLGVLVAVCGQARCVLSST